MFNRAKDDSDDGEATGDRPVPPPPGAGDDTPTDHEADTASPAEDPADDSADDAGDTSAPEPTGGRSEVEALLRRLEDVARHGGDARTPDFHRVTGAADQHAEALSATVTARREAERLLTLATQERDEAAASVGAARRRRVPSPRSGTTSPTRHHPAVSPARHPVGRNLVDTTTPSRPKDAAHVTDVTLSYRVSASTSRHGGVKIRRRWCAPGGAARR